MSYLDTEIERVTKAMKRHEKRIDDMEQQWRDAGGLCCAGCMFGQEFSEAADKCERVRYWLCVLLLKRGRDLDLERADRLAFDLPFESRKKIEYVLQRKRGADAEGARAPAPGQAP